MKYREHMQAARKEFVLHALDSCSWNVTQAAKSVDMDRAQFYQLMRKAGLERPKPVHGNEQWRALVNS